MAENTKQYNRWLVCSCNGIWYRQCPVCHSTWGHACGIDIKKFCEPHECPKCGAKMLGIDWRGTIKEKVPVRLIDANNLQLHRYNSYAEAIANAPTIDPESLRPHGKWIICSDGYYPYCSECKEEPKGGNMTKFCPNCGAKMDSEETDPFYNKANQNRLNKTIEAYERESWLNWHETKED